MNKYVNIKDINKKIGLSSLSRKDGKQLQLTFSFFSVFTGFQCYLMVGQWKASKTDLQFVYNPLLGEHWIHPVMFAVQSCVPIHHSWDGALSTPH
jgi:hypothetical protein